MFVECNREVGHNKKHHSEYGLPEVMQSLDQVAAETENVSSVMKRFYQTLGDGADKIFHSRLNLKVNKLLMIDSVYRCRQYNRTVQFGLPTNTAEGQDESVKRNSC